MKKEVTSQLGIGKHAEKYNASNKEMKRDTGMGSREGVSRVMDLAKRTADASLNNNIKAHEKAKASGDVNKGMDILQKMNDKSSAKLNKERERILKKYS